MEVANQRWYHCPMTLAASTAASARVRASTGAGSSSPATAASVEAESGPRRWSGLRELGVLEPVEIGVAGAGPAPAARVHTDVRSHEVADRRAQEAAVHDGEWSPGPLPVGEAHLDVGVPTLERQHDAAR